MMVLILIFLFGSTTQAQVIKEDIRRLELLAGQVDQTMCRDYHVLGTCSIGKIPGKIIQYLEPALVLQTVKTSGSGHAFAGTNLQFFNVHEYDYPKNKPAADELKLCPSVPIPYLRPRYYSEKDHIKWRGLGFIINPIPVAASLTDALRAVKYSSFLYTGRHVIDLPLNFLSNPLLDKIQLLSPRMSMCLGLSTDARFLEQFNYSKDGEYVWLYWRNQQCCKPVFLP